MTSNTADDGTANELKNPADLLVYDDREGTDTRKANEAIRFCKLAVLKMIN